MRRKKTNRKKLKEKLEKLAKEYVILRDKSRCQRSNELVSGQNRHVSHVIPRSQSLLLQFDPINLKVLSYHNHINWWHKNPLESGEWFKNKFPERWEYLKDKLKEPKRPIKDFELEEMLSVLEEKIKEMEGL